MSQGKGEARKIENLLEEVWRLDQKAGYVTTLSQSDRRSLEAVNQSMTPALLLDSSPRLLMQDGRRGAARGAGHSGRSGPE